jgi:hypothetical protein
MRLAPRFPRFAPVLAGALVMALAAGAGPARAGINTWTPIGPDGGAIAFLAASPAQPGLLYAAATGAGVFRSEDGGASWMRASRGLDVAVQALTVDPRSPATVYAIAGFDLWKSVDAGATWAKTTQPDREHSILSLAIAPQAPATLYAGTDTVRGSAVHQSVDGGATWKKLATGDGFFTAIAVDPSHPATVYAVDDGSNRVLRSTDSGATWVAFDVGVDFHGTTAATPVQIAVDPSAGPSVVYLAFQFDGADLTYRSADAGESWQRSGPGGYPLTVGRGVVYAGTARSTDGGVTWTPAGAPPAGALALAAAPGSATTVYAGTARGVWKSGDAAATWQPASSGLAATGIYALAIDPLHPRILYAAAAGAVQGQGLLESGSGGERWRLVGPPWLADYLGLLVVDPVTPNVLYASSSKGVAKSVDGGNTWEVLEPGRDGACPVSSLAMDPADHDTLYAACSSGGCQAFKSTDAGRSWSCLGIAAAYGIGSLAIAPGTPSTLYATGEVYLDQGLQAGMIKSTDAGVTWRIVAPGLFRRALDLLTLAIDPTDAERVFLSGERGLYRTIDGGKTWIEVDRRLPVELGTVAISLAIDPRRPATVYAAGAFGVYRSTDGGLRWSPLNDGLPDFPFAFDFDSPLNGLLVLDPRQPGKLYAGTLATGIYTYTVQ